MVGCCVGLLDLLLLSVVRMPRLVGCLMTKVYIRIGHVRVIMKWGETPTQLQTRGPLGNIVMLQLEYDEKNNVHNNTDSFIFFLRKK